MKKKRIWWDNLIFEGEYLCSNKGKEKSFTNGILEYEGKYLYDNKYDWKRLDEKGNTVNHNILSPPENRKFSEFSRGTIRCD